MSLSVFKDRFVENKEITRT